MPTIDLASDGGILALLSEKSTCSFHVDVSEQKGTIMSAAHPLPLGASVAGGDYCPETGLWRSDAANAPVLITEGHRMPCSYGNDDKWTLVLYA